MIAQWRTRRELRFGTTPIPADEVVEEISHAQLSALEREQVRRRHEADRKAGDREHIVVRHADTLRFIRAEDLEPARWWVVDTETTGSGPDHRVIEIGIAVVERRAVVDVRSCLVRATRDELAKQSAYVQRIHNIPDALVLSAPPRDAVGDRLASWYAQSGSPPCTAWPIAFDRKMVRYTWDRAQLPLRWPEHNCICGMWRQHGPATPKKRAPKLVKAAGLLGLTLPDGDAHRAGWDAHVAALIFIELMRRRDGVRSQDATTNLGM